MIVIILLVVSILFLCLWSVGQLEITKSATVNAAIAFLPWAIMFSVVINGSE